MKWSPCYLSSAVAIAVSCAVTAATYFYKIRKTDINEVLIFCKLQFNILNYFDRLINFVEAANQCVHICMPGIQSPAIQGRLVKLIKRKNIKVRIVIDQSGYNEWNSVFMDELKEAGAEIKWKGGDEKMEHKFCLVDDEVLMTGTLNWGNDLSFDDWNYVLITSKQQLVEPVKKEFYRIWESCKDGIL